MKCSTCKQDNSDVHIYALLGPVCNDCDTGSERPKKIEARLKKFVSNRKLTTYPDKLEMYDFERLVLQVCYIYLSYEEFKNKLRDQGVNPLMFIPSQLSLAVKEQIIDTLPRSLVTTQVNIGLQRWTSGGSFKFTTGTLPKAVALQSLENLDIPFPEGELDYY